LTAHRPRALGGRTQPSGSGHRSIESAESLRYSYSAYVAALKTVATIARQVNVMRHTDGYMANAEMRFARKWSN